MTRQVIYWWSLTEKPITKDTRDVFIMAEIKYMHIDGKKSNVPMRYPQRCADFVLPCMWEGELVLIAKDGFAYTLDEVICWTDNLKGGFRP